jgi:hypothetical protein
MPNFLVTYHGGGMPEGEEARQQAMADFGAWVGKTGDALADPGAPLGPSMTVSSEGVRPGDADGRVSGYSVLRADDMDSAVALVRDHPFVTRGGSLQVTAAVAP